MSKALEAQGNAFSRFYLNILRAGEASGSLEDALQRLSEYLDKAKDLRETVTTALIYPAVLVFMSMASIFVLLTLVVPQFTEMFESAGEELPLPTQVVVGLADILQSALHAGGR